MQQTTILNTAAFDARSRDALVIALLEGLKGGESFQVLSQDGEDLCRHLDALSGEGVKWEFLERGREGIKLRIEKRKDPMAKPNGGCCGCCGG